MNNWLTISEYQARSIQLSIALVLAIIFIVKIIFQKTGLDKYLSQQIKTKLKNWEYAFLTLIAVIGGVNYFYLSRSQGSWLHRWDTYHTVMTAKYFDELGYFKLYECSYILGSTSSNYFDEINKIRDLTTLKYINTEEIKLVSDCHFRFNSDREKQFVQDLHFWNSLMPIERWEKIFKDKGFNGTPFYTAIVQNFFRDNLITRDKLIYLGMIDIGLILASFYVISRSYGYYIALISFIFFCVNFPNRFTHMGGSILRFDYFAYLVFGICMLRSNKYSFSGVFFALATMVRVFPSLFAIGLGIKMSVDWYQTSKFDKNYKNFILSFLVTLIICYFVSLPVGGYRAWSDFFNNMKTHTQNTAGFRIGFRHLFMLDGNLTSSDGFIPYLEKSLQFHTHAPLYYLIIICIFVIMLLIAKNSTEIKFSIIFGITMFFTLFATTRYYYCILVLFFLLNDNNESDVKIHYKISWLFLFFITLVSYVVYNFNDFPPFIYNTLFSGMLTCLLIYILGVNMLKSKPPSTGIQ